MMESIFCYTPRMQKGKIIAEHKTNYQISAEGKEYIGTVRGVFFTGKNFPKVGDIVEFEVVAEDKVAIEKVCPRKSVVTRKAVETEDEQVIVTNVDYIFVVMGMGIDFSLSRLERYLLLATQSNVAAVVLLNKMDSARDPDTYIGEAAAVAGDVPVHAVSALTGENMEILTQYFESDETAVLLGSSGAGKSTITNWLLSEARQEVQGLRDDDGRGKHTTTSRQLFALPAGGFLIDTPGMRELGLKETAADDEDEVFSTINLLSNECQFRNCDHEKSTGCAVLAAIAAGDVTERELKSYQKLQRERLHEESKHEKEASFKYKQQKKKLYKMHDEVQEQKRFERKTDSESN
jgi:ribosome biogenesis GTPase